jgi:hypothetical protein
MSEINITIEKERVIFAIDGITISLLPLVILEQSKGKEVIRAVGSDIYSSDMRKIFLFESNNVGFVRNKKQVLDVFFRYGLQEIQKKRSLIHRFIRPIVSVKNAEILNGLLLGYQCHLIEDSLLMAGARKVKFTHKD